MAKMAHLTCARSCCLSGLVKENAPPAGRRETEACASRPLACRLIKALAVILILGGAANAQAPHVQLKNDVFELTPWTEASTTPPAGWESVFAVYAGSGDTPMLGTYSVKGNALIFRPRFPLVPGIGYHGVFKGGEFIMDPLPRSGKAATKIEHVYPSADVLPANTLKLYIYFSAPMSQGEAWHHIHLLNESGKPVPDAFLELDQELWDADNRRLTILFDPGRIKRGLASTSLPLAAGKHYRLSIDKEWHDSYGEPLAEGFEKTFTAGAADRTPPEPKRWRLHAPKAGTIEPLVVEFPKPMDYALLQRMLEVSGISGTISVSRNETQWLFTPNMPWKAGEYHLTAGNTLEDISGNHLDRAFDVEKTTKTERPATSRTASLPFYVR
jgi:hypothetical protein